jgi:putative LysE/RhtB family amino acid efflux pump
MHALTLGFGLGFVVAVQLGPMSLYLVRTTLAGGWYAGLAVGAGIALVDAAYATAGAAGAAPLLAIGPLRTVLGLVGAAVILLLGARTLRSAWTPRGVVADTRAAASPRRAFLGSLAGTAANPATIVSWAAVFAAAGAAGAADNAGGAALLVAGVGLGSLAWVSLLATGTAGAGRALGPRAIRIADVIAGVGLLAFGGVLAAHSLAFAPA